MSDKITIEEAKKYLYVRGFYAIARALDTKPEMIEVVEEMMQTISLEEAIVMKESGVTLSDLIRCVMNND